MDDYLPGPRHAGALRAMALCQSVCLSVCHKPVLYQNDRSDRACAEAFFDQSFTALDENSDISKITALTSGRLSLTLDLERFYDHGTAIVAASCQRWSTKVDFQYDTVDRSQSNSVDNTCNGRLTTCYTERLSTSEREAARRAGLSATADKR